MMAVIELLRIGNVRVSISAAGLFLVVMVLVIVTNERRN